MVSFTGIVTHVLQERLQDCPPLMSKLPRSKNHIIA